ncbi:MAG: hypothetical protein A2V52_06870 [Actinobacteria bacterium RBG_19FT_COMBO_54_7]|nr:MAG: hypothetical protein A2W01_06310 [Candidatus Solincola sediminis]OFW65413.1 MAG: hypothetical protein A2V52_06870 [Actinobacteria bacterium RBG_19FT_COMBO_54_7]
MKRIVMIALLCLVLSGLLIGLAFAQGSQETQATATAEEPEPAAEAQKPYVDWGDYRYIFTNVGPSADIDPQSAIMNWFHPSIYDANWQEGTNYVHLAITIEWWNNDRPIDFMPVQLVLHDGNRSYILFGKGSSKKSYLWRRGSHDANDIGARYPDHLHGDAKVFFTFSTRGAKIDPATAYIEVTGMLEVWDWGEDSQLYVDKNLPQFDGDIEYQGWVRPGSSYFTFTPIRRIALTEILNPAPQ